MHNYCTFFTLGHGACPRYCRVHLSASDPIGVPTLWFGLGLQWWCTLACVHAHVVLKSRSPTLRHLPLHELLSECFGLTARLLAVLQARHRTQAHLEPNHYSNTQPMECYLLFSPTITATPDPVLPAVRVLSQAWLVAPFALGLPSPFPLL